MRILVPIDGSRPAERALKFAIAFARLQKRSSIVLLNVQNQSTLTLGAPAVILPMEAEERLAAEQSARILRRALSLCRKAGVKAQTRAGIGPIAPMISRQAIRLKIDQIFKGTRGLG